MSMYYTDYLEMSENQIGSLMMRYDTLHVTNQSLVTDLEGNATEVNFITNFTTTNWWTNERETKCLFIPTQRSIYIHEGTE